MDGDPSHKLENNNEDVEEVAILTFDFVQE